MVVFNDPIDSKTERVRRVAAVEGEEMVSINENDKPFELERGACWVLCDNDLVKPKVSSTLHFETSFGMHD